jgi:hypothetical protein
MRVKIDKRLIAVIFVFLTIPHKLLLAQPTQNAALIYYQAFMVYESPDEEMRKKLYDLVKNQIAPDRQIIRYITEQQYAIDLLTTAADFPNCDWGFDYSKGVAFYVPHIQSFRELSRIVIADAKILAQQGDYKTALKRCLTLHKMSHHISDDLLITLLVACSSVNMSNECIKYILSEMPSDIKTLHWLKTELSLIYSSPFTLKNSLGNEYKLGVADMTPDRIDNMISLFLEPVTVIGSPDPTKRQVDKKRIEEKQNWEQIVRERVSKADEAFLERNRVYYKNYIDEVLLVLELQLPYKQTHTKLIEFERKLKNDSSANPDATITAVVKPPLAHVLSIKVRTNTFINAIRASITIYVVKAKTGRLPDTLPDGLPKDLFSGKDFEYEKTKDGFVLRCQGKDLSKDEIYEYPFKVQK